MITGFVKGQVLKLVLPPLAADAVNYLTGRFIFQTADWIVPGLSIWAHFRKGETQIDAELRNGLFGTDAGVNLSEGEWEVWLTGHSVNENLIGDGDLVVDGSAIRLFSAKNPIKLIAGHQYEFTLGDSKCYGYSHYHKELSPFPQYVGKSVIWQDKRGSFVYVPPETTDYYFRINNVDDAEGATVAMVDPSAIRRLTTTIAKIKVLPSGVIENEPLPTRSYGEAILAEVKSLYDAVNDLISEGNGYILEQLVDQNQTVSGILSDYSEAFTQQLADQDEAVDARLDENEALIDAAFGGLKNWKDGLWLKLWAGSEEDFAAIASPSADTIYLVGFPLQGSPDPNEGEEVSG